MEHKIIPVQGGQPPSQGMTWKEFNTSLDEIVTTSSERLRKKLFKEAEVAARFDGYRDTVPLMRLSRILSTNCPYDETLNIWSSSLTEYHMSHFLSLKHQRELILED